jgi:protein-tyrosine phosphatase
MAAAGAQSGGAPRGRGGEATTRLLFVCLGNICRSPTAEGVMRALVREAGLQDRIELDSAGTGSWHVGSPPDPRAVAAAHACGISLYGVARTVRQDDFEDFDLVLAMDSSNMRELRRLAPSRQARAKVRLLREFDPASRPRGAERPRGRVSSEDALPAQLSGLRSGWVGDDLDVPDPYYGAPGGFEEVLDLVQAACSGLLAQIRAGEHP